MITMRDLGVAAFASLATYAAGAMATPASADSSLMKSALFQWESIEARPTDVGQVRSFFREPTATLRELESHVTTLNGGKSPHPPHTHPNEELILLKEGALEAYVNGTWMPASTGSIIFFASNQPHSVRNPGSEPATYFVVNWQSSDTPSSAGDSR
jgi:XRE family transcriptional regulator, regulator of sulfur utilization